MSDNGNLLSLELQYGAFALCGLLIIVLFWVLRFVLKLLGKSNDQNERLSERNKEQNEIINNHLQHINATLDRIQERLGKLPCERGDCPEEEN